MTTIIATAGKGGTGKTTTAALIVRCLVEAGKGPVLAVDADANSNLNEALGIAIDRTIGSAREAFHDEQSRIPPGMTKEAYFEFKLSDVVIEGHDVDMIVMGRPEGSGCYCYANNILRGYIEKLHTNYPFVVVDNEAGMEHISRKVTRNPDALVIVSDHARRGIEAAGRIHALVRELDVGASRIGLVVNRVPASGMDPALEACAKESGIALLASLPEDPDVTRVDLEHGSVFDLPATSPLLAACRRLTGVLAG